MLKFFGILEYPGYLTSVLPGHLLTKSESKKEISPYTYFWLPNEVNRYFIEKPFEIFFQLTANGLHGDLGKVVPSAVEEVQKKELEANLSKLKMVDWIVLEIIKNPKIVVRPTVQVRHLQGGCQEFDIWVSHSR